jgi:flagellar basal body-associated protein FliL
MSDYYNQPPSYPPPSDPQGPQSSPFPVSPQPSQYPVSPQSPQYPQAPQSGAFPSSSSFPSYYSDSSYQGLGQQPPQPAPKSKARIILIVAAVLMFATAGVFAGLYVATESDHDKATSVLEDKKADLAGVKKDVTSAEADKSTAEDQNADLESTKTALSPCVEATQHFLWDNLSDAESQAAIDAMEAACT